ncbi:MAG TPA: C39 family peptidase [Vampirovibrionales bacterium]
MTAKIKKEIFTPQVQMPLPPSVTNLTPIREVANNGDLVEAIQDRLHSLRYLDGKIDKIWGPLTAASYARFQQACGITGEEECFGPATLKALHSQKQLAAKLALHISETTFFKRRPIQSNELALGEKISARKWQQFSIASYVLERGHYRVTFTSPIEGIFDWFVFSGHCRILSEGRVIESQPLSPSKIKLAVPYFPQRDNWFNPSGSCNVTSIAMCLRYLGVGGHGEYPQLEDELYNYCLKKGLSRHSPSDLAIVVQDYGCDDDFTSWGTVERCQKHLRNGNPCVVHGYFTAFGHIVVLVGYDDKGFLVHDPWGEWTAGGYQHKRGAFLHYSYDLIRRTCAADGEFWVHYISKRLNW